MILQHADVEGPDWIRRFESAPETEELLLARTELAGIDLSGVSGPGEEPALARAMAEVARRLR